MHAFVAFLLRQRWFVVAATLLLCIAGAVAWTRLPIDAFPDVTNVQVMVLTEAAGLSAADVEQQVTYPIEQQMGGVPRVTQVRSLSKPGLSQVIVVFEDDTDIYFARQQVFERIQGAKEQLPAGSEPELGPISTGLGEIFQYTLESETLSPMELRGIQDFLVAPQLRPIPGVNEVNSFGGFVKQYHVLVRPDALVKYGLGLREVVEALERSNANAAGGFIVRGWEQTYVRGLGQLGGVQDIREVVLKVAEGTPVHVHDVADVVVGPQPRQGGVSRDGKGEAVAGMVIMLRGANSKDVVTRVKETVPRIVKSLPQGVSLNVFYDRTSLIEACIRTVVDALLEGGIFVILVLFLFVAELRTALIVVASLPITFLATFLIMGRADISSNLMSLGGLAFSVGMVVDASIVIVENVRRHFGERREPGLRRHIAIEAVSEVARPVSFSVLIIVIVMIPLFSLQGIEGKMFAPLAATMIIAILVSLGVALTIVPVASEWLLRQDPEKEFPRPGPPPRLPRAARRGPPGALGDAGPLGRLPRRRRVRRHDGRHRVHPQPRRGRDRGQRRAPPERLPRRLGQRQRLHGAPAARALPRGDRGRQQDGARRDLRGPDGARADRPADHAQGPEGVDQRHDQGRARRGDAAGARQGARRPPLLLPADRAAGQRADLRRQERPRGQDLRRGHRAAQGVRRPGGGGARGHPPGPQDARVEQVSGMEQIEIALDRTAMARYGISVADVNETIETALAGTEATRVVEGQRRVAVVVRFPEEARADLDAVERILFAGAGGERVPLAKIATIATVEGPAQISREKGMRRVAAEVNIRGRDLGGFVAEAQQKLAGLESSLPAGYFLEYGGQFENQQRAMRRLSVVVPLALVLILVLLYMALGSIRDSLLVVLNLPFALVGGVLAIAAIGMPLSVSAAVAFIVLLGIAVQNGVVLIAFFRQLRAEGRSVEETVRIGCDLRFRPLIMTALCSFIGHLPMLYATGSGADIQKPLAVVVMGGLVTSTILTLIVLPTIYEWFENRKQSAQTEAAS